MDNQIKWLNDPSVGFVGSLLSSGLVTPSSTFVVGSKEVNLKKIDEDKRSTLKTSHGKTGSKSHTQFVPPVGCKDDGADNANESKHRTIKPRVISPFKKDSSEVSKTVFALNPSTQPSHDPENSNIMPKIETLLLNDKRFLSKKEGNDMILLYQQKLKEHTESVSDDPDSEINVSIHASEINLLFFNKIICSLRGYSEEYSKILQMIKAFFVQQFSSIPHLQEKYNMIISDKDSIIGKMNEQINQLRNSLEEKEIINRDMQDSIIESGEKYDLLMNEVTDLRTRIDQLVYENDIITNEKNQSSFRLTKAEQQISNHLITIANQDQILESNAKQLQAQDSIIHKYEEYGAGFQAQFLASQAENDRLLRIIEEKDSQISKLSLKPTTHDIETNTTLLIQVIETKEENINTKTKLKTRTRSNTRRGTEPNFGTSEIGMSPSDDKFNSSFVNPTSSSNNIASPQILKTSNNVSVSFALPSEDQTKKEDNLKRPDKTLETKPLDNQRIIQRVPSLSDVPTVVNAIPDKKESLSLIPADYNINHFQIESSSTFISSIYRLFPVPLLANISVSPIIEVKNTLESSAQRTKSYSWLLQRIVGFFHNATIPELSVSNGDPVTNVLKTHLLKECRLQGLADHIYEDIITTCNIFKSRSEGVKFFYQFLIQEFTILDFVFFHSLFGLCFELIYPPLSSTLNDPDFTHDMPQFLIHSECCEKITTVLFPHSSGESDTNSPMNPKLVSFWEFSILMIKRFRETHQQFHKQVKSLLNIVGWDQVSDITVELFKAFFIIVQPYVEKDSVEKYWKRYILEREQRGEKKTTQNTIVRFCSDYPEISNSILQLPFSPNSDQQFGKLNSSFQNLLLYLRKRFTGFIPQIIHTLPPRFEKGVEEIIIKLRNALLRSDVSTAVTCYQHFLQILDVRLSEDRPYIVFSSTVGSEEIDTLVGLLKYREEIIANGFGTITIPE